MKMDSNDWNEDMSTVVIMAEDKDFVETLRENKKMYLSKCKYCCKSVTTINFRRHKQTCSKNIEKIKLSCYKCQGSFARSDSLKLHLSKCNTLKRKGRRIICMYGQCGMSFPFKQRLISHLKIQHELNIKLPIDLHFRTINDFADWKDEEEENTSSYYSKQSGAKRKNFVDFMYFYCQHDGRARHHLNKTSRKRRRGRVKQDNVCISMIHLRVEENGSCNVKYFPTHSHPLGSTYSPESGQTTAFLSQLAQRVSQEETAQSWESPEIQEEETSNLMTSQLGTQTVEAFRENEVSFNDASISAVELPSGLIDQDSDQVGHEINVNSLFTLELQTEAPITGPPKELIYEIESSNEHCTYSLADHSVTESNTGKINNFKSKLESLLGFMESGMLPSEMVEIVTNSIDALVKKCEVVSGLTTVKKDSTIAPLSKKFNTQVPKVVKFARFVEPKKRTVNSESFRCTSFSRVIDTKEEPLYALKDEDGDIDPAADMGKGIYILDNSASAVILDHSYTPVSSRPIS